MSFKLSKFTIRINSELLKKFRFVAEFEKEHGPIEF